MTRDALDKETLYKVVQSENIESVSLAQMTSWFREEKGIEQFAPDGKCRTDPRDGSMVIYNASRAKRPHDNRSEDLPPLPSKPCPICEGKTTGIIDVKPLSSGYTFINKNLFPCVFPFETEQLEGIHTPEAESKSAARGYHLLQWTSTEHDRDWHNMPVDDLEIVIERLAALEKHLLEYGEGMPKTDRWLNTDRRTSGFVSIIKNVGAPVGGSLTHGHQQIVFSNTMPTGTFNNWKFQQTHKETFSAYLQRKNPEELNVHDLGEAAVLVPYFMKRPFFSMMLIKDITKQYLYDLNKNQRRAIATGWKTLAAAYTDMLPKMGREVAYNVLVHTGPGAGLYLEFLPFTQETGGYEQLGLWVCQGEPVDSAGILKKYF